MKSVKRIIQVIAQKLTEFFFLCVPMLYVIYQASLLFIPMATL